MAFYVKLGPRGVLFRVGTILIGCLGSWVYWRASRRRGMMIAARLTPVLVEN
jgi:hypothetical protein